MKPSIKQLLIIWEDSQGNHAMSGGIPDTNIITRLTKIQFVNVAVQGSLFMLPIEDIN